MYELGDMLYIRWICHKLVKPYQAPYAHGKIHSRIPTIRAYFVWYYSAFYDGLHDVLLHYCTYFSGVE